MLEDINFNVDMGEISIKTLEAWASRNERFVQITSDEAVLEKAFSKWESKVREQGVPERHIKAMGKEKFKSSLKRDLTVIFSREAVKQYFNCKEEAQDNEEWIQQAVDQAVEWSAEAFVKASRSLGRMMLFSVVLARDNLNDSKDEDDASDGSNAKLDNTP